jgi:hypothetical protein
MYSSETKSGLRSTGKKNIHEVGFLNIHIEKSDGRIDYTEIAL